MAYMNQEKKAKIAAKLKDVVPKGWKYSLRVRNHSTICMTIASAPVDLMAEAQRVTTARAASRSEAAPREYTPTHLDVNPYYPDYSFDASLPVIQSILAALNDGNHNRSDIMSDYFDVGWYVDIGVGTWEKPFKVA